MSDAATDPFRRFDRAEVPHEKEIPK
jgi:hypothetical protein